jgi:hypothetical protein
VKFLHKNEQRFMQSVNYRSVSEYEESEQQFSKKYS